MADKRLLVMRGLWDRRATKYAGGLITAVVLLNGCALLKVPGETVKTAGVVVTTTGKALEAAGTTAVSVIQVAGKSIENGEKAAELAANTPGAKEIIEQKVMP